MKAIAVDFAPKRRMPRGLWVSGCLVLLGFAAVGAWHAHTLVGEIDVAEARTTEMLAKRPLVGRRAAAASGSVPVDVPYAPDAAAIARIASFDVGAVMSSVESARVPGVRVAALEINAADGTARLELEVRGTPDLLKYLEDINAGLPTAEGWKLVRAQSAAPNNPGNATLVRQGR